MMFITASVTLHAPPSKGITSVVARAPRSEPYPVRERKPKHLGKNHTLRELKKTLRICINGRLDSQPGRDGKVHGPPITRGGKCADCVAVHKKSRGERGKRDRS